MAALKVLEVRLRDFHNELILAKLNFLLWSWSWVCAAMIQEWNDKSETNADGFRGNPALWQIWDWEKVMGRCVGEDGDLTFDSESVKVTRAEEKTYAVQFEKPRSGKNGYWMTDY